MNARIKKLLSVFSVVSIVLQFSFLNVFLAQAADSYASSGSDSYIGKWIELDRTASSAVTYPGPSCADNRSPATIVVSGGQNMNTSSPDYGWCFNQRVLRVSQSIAPIRISNLNLRTNVNGSSYRMNVIARTLSGGTGSYQVRLEDSQGNIGPGSLSSSLYTQNNSQQYLFTQSASSSPFSLGANDDRKYDIVIAGTSSQPVDLGAIQIEIINNSGSGPGVLGNPASIVLSSAPQNFQAGNSTSMTFQVKDQYGNIVTSDNSTQLTLNVTESTANNSASSSSTQTVNNGTVTFNVTDTQVETLSFSVSNNVSITNPSVNNVNVLPGNGNTLTLTQAPANFVAGSSTTLQFKIYDAYNNLVTTDNSTQLSLNITESSPDNSSSVTSPITVSAGVGSFTVSDNDAETLSFTVSANPSLSAPAINNITVSAASLSGLQVSNISNPITAGAFSNVTVTAIDAFGNLVSSYTGTVKFTSSDTLAVLPSNYTFTSSNQGTATIYNGVKLSTVGNKSVTATDIVNSSITGSQTVTVTSGSAVALQVTGISNPFSSGAISTLTVRAIDSFGNTVPSYTGTVMFSTTDTGATLPSNYTFTSADQGQVTLGGLTLVSMGFQTVTATDTFNSSITGSQNGINVVTGALVGFEVTGINSPIATGTSSGVTIRAVDAGNNTVTSFTGTIIFSSTDTSATFVDLNNLFPGQFTFTASNQGQVTLSNEVVFATSGTQSVTVTQYGAAITGTQSNITVYTSTGNNLVLTSAPSDFTVGGSTTLTFQVQDQYSTLIASDNSTQITLNVIEGNANSSAVVTPAATITVSGGIGTFTVSDTEAETLAFTVSSSPALNYPTINQINVNPTIASQIVMTTAPANFAAGANTNLVFQIQDQYGNLLSANNSAQLTLNITEGNANSSASISPSATVTVSGGQASFLVGDIEPETLDFTLSNNIGVSNPTINQVIVSTGNADHIAITTQPSNFTAGGSTTLTFQVQDVNNNVITSDNTTVLILSVTESISNGSSTVTTNPLVVSSGVGSFTVGDSQVETLSFSVVNSQGLTNPTINNVSVTTGAADHIFVSTQPSNFTAGGNTSMTFQIQDASNNIITSDNSTQIILAITEGNPNNSASITTVNPVTVSAGVGSFTVTDTQIETLDFSVINTGGITNPTINQINVTAAPGTQIVLAFAPTNFTAGGSTSMTFQVQDQFGNTVTSDNSTVLTLSILEGNVDGSASVTTINPVTVSAGVGSFTVTDNDAETLNFTLTSVPVLTVPTINQIIVNPGASDHIALTNVPVDFAAGTSTTMTFEIQDVYNNLVTTNNSTTITLLMSESISNSSSALIPAQSLPYTKTVSGGLTSFTVTDTQVETLSFFIVSNPALTYPVVPSVNVTQAPASQIVMTSGPNNFVAGSNTTMTFQVQDQYGNLVASDNSTVLSLTVTEGDVNSSVVVTPAAVFTVINGILTFQIDDTDAEILNFSITSLPLLTLPTINQITVSPATADHLYLANAPIDFVAGANTVLTFEVQDIYNNLVTTDNSTSLNLSLIEGIVDGTSSIILNPVTVSGGIGTLSVSDTQVETLNFTIISNPALTYPVINQVNVLPAPASQLVMTSAPADFTAGTNTTVTFEVQDQYGNIITSDNTTNVTLNITEGDVNSSVVVAPGVTAQVIAGVITFTISDTDAETIDFATTTNNGGITILPTINQITVSPATADHLYLANAPSDFVAGSNTTLTFQVQDIYNNLLIADNATQITLNVTESISDGTSSVAVNPVTVTAGSGSFTLTDTQVETLSFNVISVPALSYPVILDVDVLVDTPTDLVVTTSPIDFIAGSTTTLTFEVQDTYGNIDVSDNSTQVTLSILEGISNGTSTINGGSINPLVGTVSNGVITFTVGDMEVETLDFTVTNNASLNNPVVPQINVLVGAADHLALTTAPNNFVAGANTTLTFEVQDVYNNLLSADNTTQIILAVTESIPNASSSVVPGTTITVANGIGTFTVSDTQVETLSFNVSSVPALSYPIIPSVNVTIDTPSALVMTTSPNNFVAGSTTTVIFKVEDQYGNVDISDNSTQVTLSILEGISNGTASINGGFINPLTATVSNGSVTFVLSDTQAETLDFVVTNSGSLSNPVVPQITVTASVHSGYAISILFPPAQQNVPATFTVRAIDQYNNTTTNYLGTINFSSSAGASLPANYTFLPADNGQQSFSGTFFVQGSQTLMIQDTSTFIFSALTHIVIDAASPTVTLLNPLDNAVGVPTNVTLMMIFNEAVNIGSGNIQIRDSITNNLIESIPVTSAQVTGGGSTTLFIDISNLALSTSYYVIVPSTAFQDVSANNFAGYLLPTDWNFTTNAVDITPPNAITLSPADNSVGALVGTNLTMIFDEPVIAGVGSIQVYDDTSGGTLVDTINVTSGNVTGTGTSIITITLNISPLASNNNYHIIVPAGAFTDISSNSYAGILTATGWNFTTETLDVTPPSVLTFFPADNSTNVPIATSLALNFDEPVFGQAGNNIEIYTSVGNILVETIDAGSASVTGNGTTTITIDITDLLDNTGFYVLIDNGAFDDASGNTYPGIVSSTTWNFTTVDATLPSILSLSPLDNATNVLVAANLSITFSEIVFGQAGNDIEIYTTVGNILVETIDAASAQVTGSGTAIITINPITLLSENTDYYVLIDAGAFQDVSANNFAGIAGTTTWNFVTEDTTAPIITLLSPADNGTNVSLSSDLTITFNEIVTPVAGQNIEVYQTGGFLVETIDAGSAQVTGGGTSTITIDISNLSSNTGYYILIDAGAFEDASNNAFAGIASTTTWNFTSVDVTPPTVSIFSPADNAVGISATTNLVLTFNEVVNAVGGNNIQILTTVGDVLIETIDAASAQVTGSGTTIITINPASVLSENTDYYILIDAGAFEDSSNNAFAGIAGTTLWNFVIIDTTAPSVTVLSPPDDGTNVSTTANLTMIFNETVIPVSGQNIEVHLTSGGFLVETIDAASAQVTGGGTATINIDIANLFSNTGYYILVDAGAFEDSSNNAFAGIASTVAWNFTTVNTAAPQVNSFSPADNSTGIAITSDLVITFDQPVNVIAGQNIEVRLVAGGALVESIDAASAQVIGGGTATINIDIAALSADTAYYINIDPGAFESLASVPYVGIADAVTWNFTTVDTVPPTISTLSPLDDSVGVSVNADLVMIFNEPVIGQAGQNIEVRLVAGGALVEVVDAASAQVTGSGTTTINVNIAALTSNTAYYINIDAGAFKDTSNNSYAGISNTTDWNFTTADVSAPTVSLFSPADNASNVSTTANLVLTFNEVVNAIAAKNIYIRETAGGTLVETIDAGSGLVTGSGTNTITINPVTVLTENTGYYILIDFGAFQDVSANNFAGIASTTTWNFTTDDTTAPTISTLSPLDDSVGVSVNADLVMIFNEPVIGQAGQNIEVRLVAGGALVESIDAASAQVTGSGTSTINVNISPLAISTAYYINIDAGAFEDTFANAYAGISNTTDWNFTTAASDTTAPTIVTTNPLDEAVGVSGLTNLTITFDESVNAVAGKNIYIRETIGDALVETINAGSAQVTGGGTSTITINPAAVLTNSTGYYILLDVGAFADLAANDHSGIASKTVWNFTTGITDTTAPTIITYFPGTVGSTTMIPTDQEFGIVFSETMNISGPAFGYGNTGTDYISLVDGSSTLIPATISYTPGVGGGGLYSYFHINPNAALIDGVTYTLTVKNTITDLAGNPLNQANLVLTFQVDSALGYSGGGTMFAKIMESIIPVAHAAPILTSPSLIPSNGTVEFDVNGVISITFPYAVIPTSMLVGVGVILPFPAAMTFSSDFRTYTYTPTSALTDNTVYSIGITAAVADFNGDTLAAPFTSYFATEDSSGGTESILTIPASPNVAETSIVGSLVAYNGFIEVQFTESIDQTTVTTDPTPSPSLQVLRNGTIATNGILTRLNSTRYRFTPSSNFAQTTSYTLVVTTAVKDLDVPTASSLAAQYNQVFTTTTAPSSGGGGGGGSADHRGGDRYKYKNNNPIEGLTSNIDVACDNTTARNASDIFPDVFEISWVNPYVSALYNCGALQGNSKGLVRPWANGTRGELLSLVMKVNKVKVETGLPMPFPDVKKTSPYYDEIATAYKLGMVKGHIDGTFKENKEVTREEASKLLLNAAGFNAQVYTGTAKYKDTNAKSWSAPYIAFLKEKNITDGYADGSFKPYNWINRGELFKIIVRISKLDKKWFPPLSNDASLVLQGN